MKLTDKAVKAAAPREKDYKLADGGGLYLLVNKKGRKYWRLKYRFNKKEKVYSIGVYPDVSVKKAREEALAAKSLLDQGIDPTVRKHEDAPVQVEGLTFGKVALDWFAMKKASWSDKTTERNKSIMDLWVLPAIGDKPLEDLKPINILRACETAEIKGKLETAHRMQGMVSNVYKYGIILEYCDYNPAADIQGALKSTNKKHFASITEPEEVGRLMMLMDEYHGTLVVKTALWCSAYWFCRPGEVRHLEWEDVDLKNKLITIPKHKMKQLKNIMVQDHLIPLCDESVELLKDLYPITGRSKYVFPSARGNSRPMSENTINGAIRTMGYDKTQMTAHGFRAMARTLLDEELEYPEKYIEHQLAHEVRDVNGRAYNRTKHLPQRREMMQAWADYLRDLKYRSLNGLPIQRRHEAA